jgi:tetratricopeptide (TPR) repeat protein
MLPRLTIAFGAVLLAPHDGPAHRIEVLTKRMAKVGRTAELLFERAICHLELRHRKSALLDIQAALRLDPRHEPALLERVRTLASLRRPDAALAAAGRARSAIHTPSIRASLARAEAEILTAEGRHAESLRRLDVALRLVPEQPGVVLHRSILRGWLGQHAQRLRELQILVDKAGPRHPIIEAAWVDALIDTGQFDQALEVVGLRLRQSRFKSAWLLVRARIHIGKGRRDRAELDLMAAMRELSRRIRPKNPDLLLVADRAVALHLLGQTRASLADVRLLRARGYPLLLQLRLRLLTAR